ncbi:MAG: vitamin epoxide reductase family protein [Solirubrobacterales bacterium]|nr:vitamin epoxide reductase family protein [Solirubrobacterales bacterium]
MIESRARVAMLALAAAGLAVATYLTVVDYSGGSPVCAISHGCETVQHSRYAKLGGIPVAVLGLAGYLVVLGLVALDRSATRLAVAGATIVGFGFSAYLTYLELFQIHAICQWCVGSAAIMTALLVLAVARALDASPPPAG